MAQATELKVSLRRGVAGAGETTEAEVSMVFKLTKADGDLPALVEAKFHEVKRALVQALESEEPLGTGRPAAKDSREEGEDPHDWTAAASAKPAVSAGIAGEPDGEASAGGAGDAAPQPRPVEARLSEARPSDAQAPPEAAAGGEGVSSEDVERAPITPAQKRTILALCASAGIDGRRLQAMVETECNRPALDALGRREAGGLIFRLSRRQRERMLRERPEFNPAAPLMNVDDSDKEVCITRNGSHG